MLGSSQGLPPRAVTRNQPDQWLPDRGHSGTGRYAGVLYAHHTVCKQQSLRAVLQSYSSLTVHSRSSSTCHVAGLHGLSFDQSTLHQLNCTHGETDRQQHAASLHDGTDRCLGIPEESHPSQACSDANSGTAYPRCYAQVTGVAGAEVQRIGQQCICNPAPALGQVPYAAVVAFGSRDTDPAAFNTVWVQDPNAASSVSVIDRYGHH